MSALFHFWYIPAYLLACVLAWLLAKKSREHYPIALLLTAAIVNDAVGWLFNSYVLAPLCEKLGTSEWSGWARAAGHLSDALWLFWPAALTAAVLRTFFGVKPWWAMGLWGTLVTAMVIRHPTAANGSLGLWMGLGHGIFVVISLAVMIYWKRASKRTLRYQLSSAHKVLAIVVANEIVSLLTAIWTGPFQREPLTQLAVLAELVAIILVQGRYLWAPKSTSWA
jgi:hypothetical protein